MITKEKTEEFISRAYCTALNHGFHDEEKSVEHLLMLIISEISEAVEADRNGFRADDVAFLQRDHVHPDYNDRYDAYVKGSVEEELADVCIRLYDFCGVMCITPDTSGIYFSADNWKDKSFCERCLYLVESFFKDGLLHLTEKVSASLVFIEFLAEEIGFDLEKHIEMKMKYNESRPIRHGKKY